MSLMSCIRILAWFLQKWYRSVVIYLRVGTMFKTRGTGPGRALEGRPGDEAPSPSGKFHAIVLLKMQRHYLNLLTP